MLDSAAQRVLLVLQVEFAIGLLQPGRLHIRAIGAVVEYRYTHCHARTQVQIILHLLAYVVAAGAIMTVTQTCRYANRGIISALGNIHLHIGSIDGQLGALYFRTALKSLGISLLCTGNQREHLFVGRYLPAHIEFGVEIKFQKSLELALVVEQLSLAAGHIIACTTQLCLQLHHICLGHLPLIHHLHTTLILALSRLLQLLIHLHSLFRVHYLYI